MSRQSRRATGTQQAPTSKSGEQDKELTCLYQISHLVETSDGSLSDILRGIVELLPSAWHYPEITGARIVLGDQEFRTANYEATAPWCQSADLLVHARCQGAVQICYLEKRPHSDEGPFASAERSLLDAVAERLGRIVERLQAQEELRWNEVTLSTIADPISYVDRNYVYRFVNQTYSRYAKRPRQEIVGRTVAELLGAETFQASVKPHLDRCFREPITVPPSTAGWNASRTSFNAACVVAEFSMSMRKKLSLCLAAVQRSRYSS